VSGPGSFCTEVVGRFGESDRWGCAHLFRPTYAVANVGHPSPWCMDFAKTESVPQGLKPASAPSRFGTAEAVPFVNDSLTPRGLYWAEAVPFVRQTFTAACFAPERVAIAFLLMLFAGFSVCRVDAAEQGFPEVEILVRQGRLAEAEAKIQEELQTQPSVEGYNLLGLIEGERQELPSAVAAFQRALQLSPKSASTHNNLGNIYMAQKKLDLAEKEFRNALRLDPANLEANLNLIRAYLESKQASEGLQMATEFSQQHKNEVPAQLSLGILLASEGQYKAAKLALEKADVLKPRTFEILYNLGQTLLLNGEYSQADLVLNRALALKPESPETLYLLAQVLADESRPMDALALLVRAHKIATENTDIILLMAQISISQNYFEDAIPLLESGVAIAPQRADLHAALGESYLQSDRMGKAVEEFDKVIAIAPSAQAYALLGLSYQRLGRFEEAKQNFQRGLKLDPHNLGCLFNLGLIAERQGDAAGADAKFQEVLRLNPNYADALLELANLRIGSKKLPEAAELLRKYVKVSRNPATGYYKLAMVERSLHETAAADGDLDRFQTLSKSAPSGQHANEHLFDYLNSRSKLDPRARTQMDIAEITEQLRTHPDQPEGLYLLAEAYLKSGKVDEAKSTIAQLDKVSAHDGRVLTGVGVLLARYHLYDDAIQHFQVAAQANPDADEIKFDLADAYFRKGLYPQALDAAQQVSEQGRKDDAYLALLGDIYAHLNDAAHAEEIYRDALSRNPDNDQDYLALALLQLREHDIAGAKQTLVQGQARVPGSGKILWGLGLASALEGNTAEAGQQFERAVEMLPEWPGSYSTLGVFYFQTGQIDKAKEVLSRFKNSSGNGALDINRIEQVLAQAPATSPAANEPMTMANRQQLLRLALSLADRTL
jgi:tetratricopeptide (TPR) repeat protein